MKRFFRSACPLILAALAPITSFAQATAVPVQLTGTTYELTTYDAQHRPNGRVMGRVINLHASAAATEATLHHDLYNTDNQLLDQYDMTARFSSKGPVLLDVRAFVGPNLLRALQLNTLEQKADSLAIMPTAASPGGEVLPDASLTLVSRPSATPRGVEFSLTGRWLAGTEKVVTPAGTFDCMKMTQNLLIESFVAGAQRRYNVRLLSWYAPQVGVIRSETYVGDKLFDAIELTRLLAPGVADVGTGTINAMAVDK